MTSSIFDVITRAQFNGLGYSPAAAIFAVEGTVYPGAPAPASYVLNDGTGYWCGFSSGIVGGLADTQDGLFASMCTGYPAVVTPMWPSTQIGRANTVANIKAYADGYHAAHGNYDNLAIFLTGYSQGAMATGQVYVLDFLAPNGVLNYLLPNLWRVYQFGDPFRTPGIAHGNELAGLPLPKKLDGQVTGGIGGSLCLTADQTNRPAPDGKPTVVSCANDGDLYACCPVGTDPWRKMAKPGKVGNGIFKVIMQATFLDVIAVAGDLFIPVSMVEEIINGIKFAAAGQSPHMSYGPQMDACIGEALAIGNSLPHQSGY